MVNITLTDDSGKDGLWHSMARVQRKMTIDGQYAQGGIKQWVSEPEPTILKA